MSKRKLAALVVMTSGFLMALGVSCIPNLGSALQIPGLGNLTNLLGGLRLF